LIIPTAGNPKGFATFLDSIFHRKSPNHRIPGFGSSPTMLIAFFTGYNANVARFLEKSTQFARGPLAVA
jgi:hypothetical protein